MWRWAAPIASAQRVVSVVRARAPLVAGVAVRHGEQAGVKGGPVGAHLVGDVMVQRVRGAAKHRERAGIFVHGKGDRRPVTVRLSAAGRGAFEGRAGPEEADEVAFVAALSAAEQRTPADLLRKPVVAVETGPGTTDRGPHAPRRSRSTGT
ncbi:hypothetical protein ACIHIX_31270 [Streptomyces sp. NPDC051913]|uniref:hypothetical protein n=1 Tax=Streptomyces sp. NPDC051913 TaxID=3365676 RepID=UPI0037D91745